MEQEDKATCGYSTNNFFKYHWRGVIIFLVPLIFLPLIVNNWERPYRCLYVVVVMSLFWITDVIPIYVTGLLPILLLPIFGVMASGKVAVEYFNEPMVIFVGSLIAALSIEYCNLHKRIALGLILMIGIGPKRLLASLIILAGFFSMWFQNTAVATFMCPIVRAVLEEFQGHGALKMYRDKEAGDPADQEPEPTKVTIGYYLAVAYAATIGGCSTLIGTATNVAFKGMYECRFPNSTDPISFGRFMVYNVPWVLVDLILLFFIICLLYLGMCRPNSEEGQGIASLSKGTDAVTELIKQQYSELGPITLHEIQVIILFLLMVNFLFFRKPGFMSGWYSIVTDKDIGASAPIMATVILLFYLPTNYSFLRYCFYKGPFPNTPMPTLLSWRFVHVHFPWGLIFLLGGGYALAIASAQSGLADMLADNFKFFGDLPLGVLQFLAIVTGAFFTAFSSNVAICNIIVPVMAEIAVSSKVHPLYLIFPAGLGCSVAFLLPVSTPPNAVVASYANIRTKSFLLGGIIPTIATIACVYATVALWHNVVYPEADKFPDWTKATTK